MAGYPGSILGRRGDWTYLYGPPLLVAVLVAWSMRAPTVAWLVLVPLAAFPGLAHVFSTSIVYLDGYNRSVFARRSRIFYHAPLGLLLAAAAILWWVPPAPAETLLLLVAIWHNTRQSLGILNLTRRAAGGDDATRHSEHAFVWTGNAACLAFAAAPVLPSAAVWPLRITALLAIAAALAAVVRDHARRPAPRRAAHWAFLWISASLAWPLVAVGERLLAWALMSLPHQVQYLGILWTAQGRRYGVDAASESAHPILLRLVRDGILFCSVLAAAAALALAVEGAPAGTLQRLGALLVMGATLSHYWLDSFLWRWRDPEIRGLLLAPLTRPDRPERAAA